MLHAYTCNTGVPVVLFSLASVPSFVVNVVPVGVAAIVFTPLQPSKTPPLNPPILTCVPAARLCAAEVVYVATPLVRTQLVSVLSVVRPSVA